MALIGLKQLDRKVSMEVIEKMRKPKAVKHKKNISRAMILYHQNKKEELESLKYKELEWLNLD